MGPAAPFIAFVGQLNMCGWAARNAKQKYKRVENIMRIRGYIYASSRTYKSRA